MTFYQAHNIDPRKLQNRFRGREEIESRYTPQFPLSTEREYKRLARDLQRDFDKQIEPYIIAALTAIRELQPIPDAPAYTPPEYLERRINAIAALLTRHTIRQWEISVKRTLGFDINRDYYHGMISVQMQNWAREQRQRIEQRIQEAISEVEIALQTNAPLLEIAEEAEKKSTDLLTALNFLTVSSVGVIYSDMFEAFSRDTWTGGTLDAESIAATQRAIEEAAAELEKAIVANEKAIEEERAARQARKMAKAEAKRIEAEKKLSEKKAEIAEAAKKKAQLEAEALKEMAAYDEAKRAAEEAHYAKVAAKQVKKAADEANIDASQAKKDADAAAVKRMEAEAAEKEAAAALAAAKATQAGAKYKWINRPWASKTGTRPDHKALNMKIFLWDDPPVINHATQKTGHPGDDFNCKCIAKPIFSNPLLR